MLSFYPQKLRREMKSSISLNFDDFCIGFSWKTESAKGFLLEVINAESDAAHEGREGNLRRQGPAQQHPPSINCAPRMVVVHFGFPIGAFGNDAHRRSLCPHAFGGHPSC